MVRIGVLALQGSVVEHMNMLKAFDDVEATTVKTKEDLKGIDGIILPGGESTAISKLLWEFDLFDLLKKRLEDGLPAFGTCAGMILLAKKIKKEEPHLAVMDIKVKRNAYGRQIESFNKRAVIPEIGEKQIELVFIRAPWIEKVYGKAKALCTVDNHIVAARQGNMLVTSFHSELTNDLSVHKYFLSIVKKA